MKHSRFVAAALVVVAAFASPGRAADPASGDITEDTLKLEWTGGGPYAVPNVTPAAGDPVPVLCQPTVPVTCDQFSFTVDLSDEFREKPEYQRESVSVGISFPTTTSQEDYDLYLFDAAGTLIGESASGGQETITVPLKKLANGSYTVNVIPFLPLASNYTGVVQVGKDGAAAGKSGNSPMGGSINWVTLFALLSLGLSRFARRQIH